MRAKKTSMPTVPPLPFVTTATADADANDGSAFLSTEGEPRGRGVAPLASLAGMRLNLTGTQISDALLFNNGGPTAAARIPIKNHSYGVGAPFVPSAPILFALGTCAQAGTINVYSAGNERGGPGQDSNKKATQASVHAIPVAALGSQGGFRNDSNFGANLTVTAPSSNSVGLPGQTGIFTTDRLTDPIGYSATENFSDGDYTTDFGGTSSSAPTVSGVLAIVKQAQPALNTRMAKHLRWRAPPASRWGIPPIGGIRPEPERTATKSLQ